MTTRYTWRQYHPRGFAVLLPDVELGVILCAGGGYRWGIRTLSVDETIFGEDVTSEPEPYPTLEAAQVACENFYWRHILYPEATQ